MERIRQGNDLTILWEIMQGEQPYNLEGRSLALYVVGPYGRAKAEGYTVTGNVLQWTFRGAEQKTAGVYSLTLIENNGSEGMRTVDECNAFELVTHSCKAGGDAESRVSIETVRLRSVMTLSDVVPDKELNKNSTNVVENGAIAREFEKQNGAIEQKQDIIPDLEIIREGASKGATALQEHQDISGKADTSGRYPEMSVGFSDDLVGRGESVPAEFSFRASGGKSIKDGSARTKRLKGNSVVWNNMVDTREHAEGFVIYEGVKILQGHKYLLQRSAANSGLYLIPIVDGSENYDMVIRAGEYAKIFTSQYTDLIGARVYAAEYSGACVVSDLTLMFGAGNEPTTIEEYNARKPIVADEYAYNEGEVIHMTAEGVKSVGDNAWDEEWEVGAIENNTGTIKPSNSHIRSKNYIKVISGETYYMLGNFIVIYYDENYNQVDWWSVGGSRELTIPSNVQYIKIYAEGNTYNHDITISLYHSGWKAEDAKYQPYWEDRLMFDKRIKDEFPNGMHKWDMVYNKNGKGYIVKGTGVVDLGTLEWYDNVTVNEGVRFAANKENWTHPIDNAMLGNIICPRYSVISANDSYLEQQGVALGRFGDIFIYDSSYTDAASFKASLQGVMLYYQLAEPTIIEYDEPFNLDYKVADFGTEEIIAPQPSAPISADIIYQFNAVDMIREHELEITELQRIIATMQAQLTSLTSNNGGQ